MKTAYLCQSLQFVWHSSKKWTILLLLVQVLQALLPLGLLYLTKLIVDTITVADGMNNWEVVAGYVLAFGGIQLVLAVLQNYQQLISETQQQLVTDYMSEVIIEKAVSIDMSYYENAGYHDTFHQAQRQAMFRPVQILRNLTDLLRSGLLLVSLAGLLVFLHWSIALILLAFALPVAGVKWYYSKKMYEWERRRTSLEREAAYLNQVLTTDSYAKEVRLFNLGTPLMERFKIVRRELFKEKYRIGRQRARAGLLAQVAEILALVTTYGFIIWRTLLGSITLGDLVMFFQAFQRGQTAIKQALQGLVGLYNNRLFLSHLFELLNVESRLKITSNPQLLPANLQSGIEFKNVHFSYPNTERAVLQQVNLHFKKGEVIALVGENGSGKTTLIKLLGRLYDPTAGQVCYDDIDVKNIELSDLRKRISVIYQDFAQYHFTAADNIQIGDLNAEVNVQKTQRAAHQSGAADFIAALPQQYQQQLGRRFKKGTELSGGQWQKIALARAFYKSADLIILDEPTSAIDPLAEAAIFNQLRELAKDKILILVTHRLYNLRMADRIVVLDEGRVVEEGTHTELFTQDGLYRRMFEQQVETETVDGRR